MSIARVAYTGVVFLAGLGIGAIWSPRSPAASRLATHLTPAERDCDL